MSAGQSMVEVRQGVESANGELLLLFQTRMRSN